MKYWNSRLKNTEEYIPGEQPGDPESYIKLNTNESPFPPPKSVLEAIKKECNENLRYYPDPTAFEVRKIFAEMNGLEPDNIFISNGSDEIFSLLFRGFIEPSGKAAFAFPSYSLYNTFAEINGISYDTIDLKKDFSFDLGKFLKKKYDLVILSNPNNPTGTYCEVEEIRKFLSKFKGLLVVDEAYIDFYNGSSLELIDEFDNVIVTRSFSKSYSLAGMRIGIAVSNKDMIRGFMKIKDSYNIDRLAIAAAKAALLDTKGFRYNLQMTINNKEYLEERLEGLGFTIIPSRANFLLVRHPDFSSETLYKELKERNIFIRHFNSPLVSEYIRISVGSMMNIKKLCNELTEIMES